MARLARIIATIALCVWRSEKSLGSFASNNFFLFSVILLRQAGAFVYVVVAVILFFPLCTDPLRKIPPERLALWPLSRSDRGLLRAISPWANLMTWLLAALVIWTVREVFTAGLLAAASALFVTSFLLTAIRAPGQEMVWRSVPGIPGPMSELIRKNLRGLVTTLDFYAALILSVSAAGYRLFGAQPLPAEALLALTLLVVLALSSYSQSLFGLDGESGMTRYRLLPVRGWRILAAKGVALIAVISVLTLPLAPLAGIAAGLAAIAVGNAPSVNHPRDQMRWRFSSGASFGNGVLQIFALSSAGVGAFHTGPLVLAACLAVYSISVWWFGRALEQTPID